MNTTHNHPPRCCCEIPAGHAVADFRTNTPGPQDCCPLCPEHGELAQLGNTRVIDSARITAATPNGEVSLDQVTSHDEYPCCHQLVGRPHTDYCPTRHPEAHPHTI